MNLIQYLITICMAVVFASLTGWMNFVAEGNSKLAEEQTRLQTVAATARNQQAVLQQLLQRSAVLGQYDPMIIELLGKYGVQLKQN